MAPVDYLLRAALAQHSAFLFRASTGAVQKVDAVLLAALDSVSRELSVQLADLSDYERAQLTIGKWSTPRLRALRDTLTGWKDTLLEDVVSAFHTTGEQLTGAEVTYASKLLRAVLQDIPRLDVDPAAEYAAAVEQPVLGKLLDDTLAEMADNASRTVIQTVRQGVAAGSTTELIVRTLRGTRAAKFKDGAFNITRTAATALVRTTRTHISAQAYQRTYAALGVTHVVVCATLDGRTSLYCATHDGVKYDVDKPYPAPPYHPNCRTVLLPDVGGMRVRPYVADSRAVKDIPQGERDGLIGQTSGATFGSWFAEQSAAFQREWLGPTRFKLYNEGHFPLDRFVDPQGKTYTIEQLRERDRATFNELFGDSDGI